MGSSFAFCAEAVVRLVLHASHCCVFRHRRCLASPKAILCTCPATPHNAFCCGIVRDRFTASSFPATRQRALVMGVADFLAAFADRALRSHRHAQSSHASDCPNGDGDFEFGFTHFDGLPVLHGTYLHRSRLAKRHWQNRSS